MSPSLLLTSPRPPLGATPGAASDEALALVAGEQVDGSREAFELLVERYGSRIRAVIEKQVGDHHLAMDLTQDVWIRVHRALPRFRPARDGGHFRSWLFSIALNLVRDRQRSRKWRQSRVTASQSELSPASERYNPSGRVEELAAIDKALHAVPEPFGTALHLVDVIGHSYQEAADCLECSVGTVKSRVNRGRLAFRDLYLQCSGETSHHPLETRSELR